MTMVKFAKKHMFFWNFKPVFEGLDQAKTENYFKMFKMQIPHTQIAIISTWRNTANKSHETLHGNFVVWVWPSLFSFFTFFLSPCVFDYFRNDRIFDELVLYIHEPLVRFCGIIFLGFDARLVDQESVVEDQKVIVH